MIQLCCPAAVFKEYIGDVPPNKMFLDANGELSFEQATKSLNKYTTTLHGINSSIIKLGKLTKATKVYRGISGMALPKEFWTPNAFGVRGGVESAFMSTTLEGKVAMGYAEGDGSRMGIVIEVQQGMVNRGADISWLSQYPHEQVRSCAADFSLELCSFDSHAVTRLILPAYSGNPIRPSHWRRSAADAH